MQSRTCCMESTSNRGRIQLCRLRYWLSLLVDLPPGAEPQPLPNLEYRTVVANSLVDFVGGVEVQNTRGGLSFFEDEALTQLHREWFDATGEKKEALRVRIDRTETEAIAVVLTEARRAVRRRFEGGGTLTSELQRIDQLGGTIPFP